MSPVALVPTIQPLVLFSPVASPQQGEADRLGDAIAELASRIHAATYELLVLIRQFDACAGWNEPRPFIGPQPTGLVSFAVSVWRAARAGGCLSCAHWLNPGPPTRVSQRVGVAWRTGIDLGAAREKVRVARALAELPRLSAAIQRGELSYAKVRALTRVATPTNEPQLLDVAPCGTAAHVERLVRAWRRVDRTIAAQEAQRRHQHRQRHTWIDDGGMLVIRGRLTPEVGAAIVKLTSSRNYESSSHPALRRAGVMNLVQMSRSLSSFLFTEGTAGRPRRGLAYLLHDQRRNLSLPGGLPQGNRTSRRS